MLDPKTLADALRMIADGLDLLASGASPAALNAATNTSTKGADDKAAADKAAADKKAAEAEAAKKKAAADKKAAEEEAEAAEAKKAEDKAAASEDDGGEIKLSDLQDQAAVLLAGGHRRTLKTILDEVGVKSLSTAEAEHYPALKEKLAEAIEGMELT